MSKPSDFALRILMLLAACSDAAPFARAVFVGAEYQTVECDDGDPVGCVRVFSEIEGSAVGEGRCILYATTSEGQVAVAASGELELNPGELLEWTVRVPSHFDQWNPVCVPRAEG